MKIVVHGAGRVLRHDEIELVNARLFYGLYGFEIFDEIRPAPRADAVYLIKRGDIPLVSEGALILYGEAVRFLLYAADEREHSLICVYADLLPLRAYERPCAVAVVLDHAEHRHA